VVFGFTQVVLLVLAASLVTRLWLAHRQVGHVRAHRQQVPAAFKGRIALSAHRKAADYTIAKTRFGMLAMIVDAILLVVWTLGGGFELLDQGWRSFGYGPITMGAGFLVSAFLIMSLLDLPVTLYQTFGIEQRFGFNRVSPGLFIADLLKQWLLMLGLGLPLALAALWLMAAGGEIWWVYVWLLWSGFSLFMIWAYPTVIAPLFNTFVPLKTGPVLKRVERLLARTGFQSRGVYVMDGSRRSAHGNAYFTGFGRSKRIVFFDTLLKSLRGPEIEAVLAHELGHFRHHHVLKRIALMFAISLASLALLGWLSQQPWFYHELGITTPSNHAALMLFLTVGPVFSFFLQPVMAWGSRRHEYEADAFAAEQADVQAMIRALVKLYRENASTLTPDPVYSAFYDSHPPALLRIAHLRAQT